MIELDNPNWKLLRHAYGSAEDIPEMLVNLRKNDQTNDDDLFYGCLCHQYSLYSATFAAIPHLVEIMQQTHNKELKCDILVFCGMVYAYDFWENYQYKKNNIVLSELRASLSTELMLSIQMDYFQVIPFIHAIALDLLKDQNLAEEDKEYTILTIAAINQCGDFARVGLSFPFSSQEFICTCPHCNIELEIKTENQKLISYQKTNFTKNLIQPRSINIKKWNGEYNREQLPFWLKSLSISAKVPYLYLIVEYLFGTVTCNSCSGTFHLIDRLEEES